MPVYWEQNVGGVQVKNSDIGEDHEDYEIQKPQMKNAKDEEQIKDPMMNIILIFDMQMSNKSVSNNFRKATLDIGTCNYHGWPWDISLGGKLHWHLFHHIF